MGDVRPLFEDALANGSGDNWFAHGDYDRAVRGSQPLAATYYAAPSMHLGLEPLSATAGRPGELWAATQAPGDAVTFPMPPGEPAGRALEADAANIADELSRAVGRPVQAILSQSASQNHDHASGGALARLSALPGPAGITAAWKMKIASGGGFGAALAALEGKQAPSKLALDLDGSAPPYSISDVAIDAIEVPVPFEAGYMRGSPQRELTFFIESFIDELAHVSGVEPLAFRMAMLGTNGRLARCLQGAARLSQWDGGGPGSTMGIAGASAFGSHIGLVAGASIGEDQRVKVHRLFAAVDCGKAINPGLIQQQIEAGLIWALAQATVAASEWIAGMPRARPYGGIALPRIGDIPEIVVEIIPSSEPPGGVSGLGAIPLAPAVANALFAGSGKRMRSLPFDPMSA
jgi:isoquinoline 1-oxidoreductase beta subunit